MRLLGVLTLVGSAAVGAACCGIGQRGASVRFVGQTNIVVWDKARGIEHFMRDAQFSSNGKGLGFIAPTPSRPTLAGTSQAAFLTLAALEPRPEFVPKEWTLFNTTDSAAIAESPVSVIDEVDVAGYHATVLKATDSQALGEWLKSNGYPKPRFLDGWVKPYLDRGWYLTAFKVKGAPQSDYTATGPVRMTFATKRPFNPYSVPEANGDGTASLRLYYISAGNELPKIGGTTVWRSAEWSAPILEETRVDLARQLKLPPNELPANASVTAYRDNQFGQPGLDDLYFVEDSKADVTRGAGAVALLALVVVGVRRKVVRA